MRNKHIRAPGGLLASAMAFFPSHLPGRRVSVRPNAWRLRHPYFDAMAPTHFVGGQRLPGNRPSWHPHQGIREQFRRARRAAA